MVTERMRVRKTDEWESPRPMHSVARFTDFNAYLGSFPALECWGYPSIVGCADYEDRYQWIS